MNGQWLEPFFPDSWGHPSALGRAVHFTSPGGEAQPGIAIPLGTMGSNFSLPRQKWDWASAWVGMIGEDSFSLPSWAPPPGQNLALQLGRMCLPQHQAQWTHESHEEPCRWPGGVQAPWCLIGPNLCQCCWKWKWKTATILWFKN
jgi:hypothetical protein